MKKIATCLFGLLFVSSLAPITHAVHVSGYMRKNGTYVNSYERTAPDGNPYNNYGYPGNYNPNTGQITGGSEDAYLNNYYKTSSYSSPSYDSYPTTPTCPLNSYYDGVSSCKCNYGYTVSGGNCVSQDSLCQSQIGYSSSYDSSNNTCKCDYGYVLNKYQQCQSATLVCSDQIGLMSQYNSYTNKCECMSGYYYNGSSCVYKNTDSYGQSASAYSAVYKPSQTLTCPAGNVCTPDPIANQGGDCPIGYDCTPVQPDPNAVTSFNATGVISSIASFRNCPSKTCGLIRFYPVGSRVNITGKNSTGDWYQVSGTTQVGTRGTSITGWISKSLFKSTY